MNELISCSERFPNDHHPAYMVLDKAGAWHKVYIDGWYQGNTDNFIPSHWIHSEGHRCELDEFTHWKDTDE